MDETAVNGPATGPRAGYRPSPRIRRLALLGWDSTAWVVGLSVAAWLRYEGDLHLVDGTGLVLTSGVALVTHWLVAFPLHLYRGRYWTGSADDALSVTVAMGVAGVVTFGTALVPALLAVPLSVPRSVPLTGALIALALAVGARFAVRRHRARGGSPDHPTARRVIVFGAGPEGQHLVRSMCPGAGDDHLAVAVLDDDAEVQGRRIGRISVRGTREDIAEVAAATCADLLVVASPQAPAAMDEINRAASATGLAVKVLPSFSELLRPWAGVSDLRDLDIADLLGRCPVDVDVAVIAGYLSGRRVLVTGAGGSVGSELCRQIHRFGPAELLMLDRDESALHATQLSLCGRALLDSPDVILADIRDAEVITALFRERRPEVIFHAAALKHLCLLEQYPEEAWKTNVIGTHNVLEAARACGARRFVNISTDKAADPTSVLGRTKRIGERLVAEAATHTDGTYLSVRFGNVLGSRGSVLTTFSEQIAAGGPVTVTHPDVTRFFMTIPEAAQLVVHAAAIGRPGEALVLDMGDPVRIQDVARRLMEIAGRRVDIVYTGLRPGEKLDEQLLGAGECDLRPVHPAVSHVDVPALPMLWVADQCALVGAEQAMVDLPLLAEAPVRDPWSSVSLIPQQRRS